jgi:hypothetical protein
MVDLKAVPWEIGDRHGLVRADLEIYMKPGGYSRVSRSSPASGWLRPERRYGPLGINRENEPDGGLMIAKTFFLAKIIHRIGTKNLRDKKSLRENLGR